MTAACHIRLLLALLLLALPSLAAAGSREEALATANRLSLELERASDQARYLDAVALGKRALAIRERELGSEHPHTLQALHSLGVAHEEADDFAAAEPLLRRAAAARQRVLGEHAQTAASLHKLGNLLRRMGRYAEAEKVLQRALGMREKVLGREHAETASALGSLALLYRNLDQYAKAVPMALRVVAICEKEHGREHPQTATALANLANLYVDTGAYDKAEPLYLRALAIRTKALGPDHQVTAYSLANLGSLYKMRAAYQQAEARFSQALAILEKRLGPEHTDIADMLYRLGDVESLTGAYAQAEALYQRALQIYSKQLGAQHPDTVSAVAALGALYADTGAHAKAEEYLQRALDGYAVSMGKQHARNLFPLNKLAQSQIARGLAAQAQQTSQRMLAIAEQSLGPQDRTTAYALTNLGVAHSLAGNTVQARKYLERALVIYEQVLGTEHPETADALADLAEVYANSGQLAKSAALYTRSIAASRKHLGNDHPTVAGLLTRQASLSWRRGRLEEALAGFQRAQAAQARYNEGFLFTSSEARKVAWLEALVTDVYRRVSFSTASTGLASTQLGFISVLQYKGRVLDSMSDSVARLRQSVAAADQQLFEELASVANELSVLTYQGPEDLTLAEHAQRVQDLQQRQERLEARLAERSREFRQQVTPVTLAAVRKALPPRTVLVEWFRYKPFDSQAADAKARWSEPRYVAYLLRASGELVSVDLGDARGIDALVSDLRGALANPRSTDVQARSAALSQQIWQPLQPYLQGIEHVLMAPDGALNLVPMAALLDEQGRYITERYQITYLTSGRDLLRFASPTQLRGGDVVMAAPDYGPFTRPTQSGEPLLAQRSVDIDRSGLQFRPLAGTAQEAVAIGKLLDLQPDGLLVHAKASEANLKQLKGPRILHLATHGFFLSDQQLSGSTGSMLPRGENPLLRSGIALAGANARRSGGRQDGILTALEAAQLDLRGTELVVLSACEGGVGEIQNGEGVYGLRRALVLAGVQTQITSLWKVADEPTRRLMVDYYRGLLQGRGRSASLREAQRAMLAIPTRAHPYFWASFVPIGNWTPLPGLEQ